MEKNEIDLVALFVFGKFRKADIIHHSKGRDRYKCDINTFIATTKEGDKWIHKPKNQKKAFELGFLERLSYDKPIFNVDNRPIKN